jgi:Na+-translocating ferredoxin:NAD+ oxidoreductase RnfG subunit
MNRQNRFLTIGFGVIICLAIFIVLSELSIRLRPFEVNYKKMPLTVQLSRIVGDFNNDPIEDSMTLLGPKDKKMKYYRARNGKTVTSVVFCGRAEGYRKPVSFLVGLNREGRIIRVRLVDEKGTTNFATPGLTNEWFDQFQNLQAADLELRQFGGAIDPLNRMLAPSIRIVKAAREGVEFFNAHQSEILGE